MLKHSIPLSATLPLVHKCGTTPHAVHAFHTYFTRPLLSFRFSLSFALSFLVMLFKTRSGLTPQTPKIGSVSLPADNATPFSMLFSPLSRKRSSLERRATTPAPERPPTQSASYHDPSMRTRTASFTGSTAGKGGKIMLIVSVTSMLNHVFHLAPLKSILKTPKVEPSTPLYGE